MHGGECMKMHHMGALSKFSNEQSIHIQADTTKQLKRKEQIAFSCVTFLHAFQICGGNGAL